MYSPTDLPPLEGVDDLGPYWDCPECTRRYRSAAARERCCRERYND